MHCDREKLTEFRDGGLRGADRVAVEEHLANCAACRASMSEVSKRKDRIAARLDRLEPGRRDVPEAGAAYARFQVEAQQGDSAYRHSAYGHSARHDSTHNDSVHHDSAYAVRPLSSRLLSRLGGSDLRWRPLAAAVGVAAALVIGISYAPARQVLADFLKIFRVREFSVITIDRAQLGKLETLKESLRASNLLTPTTEREPAQPRATASLGEARGLAGFDVQAPDHLPAGAQPKEIDVVAPGPAVRIDFDPAKIEAQLAAAGISGVRLPPMEAGSVRAEVAAIVTQEIAIPWTGSPDRAPHLRIVQAASPSVTLPPGADPGALGETYLKILGLPDADAKVLAARIDWTGTLLIPMPQGLGTFREIKVGGEPGLYMEQAGPEDAPRRASVVLWQHDGVIRAVIGDRIAASEMLQIAESMR